MNSILKTENLTKRYKNSIAVKSLNISIKRNEIYALIGKNGAGKTSLLKMITGLSIPSEGKIGVDKECNVIGTLIESPGLMMNLSGYDNLKAKCIGLNKYSHQYICELLNMVSLEKAAKKKVKHYSLGMKQRLSIALALIGDPQLLILDEPINGLDPQGIAHIRELLKKINEEKDITIIISSHILEELSKIATRYGFINNGVIVKEIEADQLAEECKQKNISLEEYYFSLVGGRIYD